MLIGPSNAISGPKSSPKCTFVEYGYDFYLDLASLSSSSSSSSSSSHSFFFFFFSSDIFKYYK
jgi:hypothetical protein